MKNIVFIFLGKFSTDARCQNMASSILKSTNYKLSIICLNDQNVDNQIFNKINFYYLNISRIKFYKYYDFYKKTKKILTKARFDIVIAADLYSLAGCRFNKNQKLIYDCREIYTELEAHINKPFYKLLWKYYEKHYLKFVDKVMITAKSDKLFMQKNYSNHNHLSYRIIYNYPKYEKYTKKNLLHKKFKINQKFKIILYQGVVQSGRGILKLIKFINQNREYKAVIIGDGNQKLNYIKHVKINKDENNVFFMNAVPYDDLFQYTASADVGWLMLSKQSVSNQFALPNKLFEYILMGLPIISSNINNIKKIIDDYPVGVIINNEDDFSEIKQSLDLILKLNSVALHNIAKNNFVWGGKNTVEADFLKIIDAK